MAIEDVLQAVREEQRRIEEEQRTQAAAEAATKGTQRGKQDSKVRQQALQDIAEKEVLYRMYIAQLASGRAKGKKLAPETLKRIEDAAVSLSNEIQSLRLKANPPTPEKPRMVGSIQESKLPFGGQAVAGGATGPIAGGIDTTKTITPTKTTTLPPSTSLTPEKNKKDKNKKDKTPEVKLTKEEILNKYPIIDALFEQDAELRALLDKYLNKENKMTLAQLKKELGQAQYNFKYADIIKDRLAKKAIFDRLGASATGQSDYEREVARIAAAMEATAIDLGASVTKEDLNRLASNIYMAGTEANPLVIERALTPYIKLGVSPTTGRPTVGGAAGANYQTLVNTAKANGIKEENLARSLGFASADDILRRLAEGEPIGTFQQRLRDIAAYGRSDYVKNLLAQGTDFDVIISPYRNMMADVLEIANPEQISLDDPTLSMALGKEEMTLSDFRRALRKDARWQYTENAREDIASTAMNILQRFGFQG